MVELNLIEIEESWKTPEQQMYGMLIEMDRKFREENAYELDKRVVSYKYEKLHV